MRTRIIKACACARVHVSLINLFASCYGECVKIKAILGADAVTEINVRKLIITFITHTVRTGTIIIIRTGSLKNNFDL